MSQITRVCMPATAHGGADGLRCCPACQRKQMVLVTVGGRSEMTVESQLSATISEGDFRTAILDDAPGHELAFSPTPETIWPLFHVRFHQHLPILGRLNSVACDIAIGWIRRLSLRVNTNTDQLIGINISQLKGYYIKCWWACTRLLFTVRRILNSHVTFIEYRIIVVGICGSYISTICRFKASSILLFEHLSGSTPTSFLHFILCFIYCCYGVGDSHSCKQTKRRCDDGYAISGHLIDHSTPHGSI